ncbi:hypothetical protein [Clostridium fallax]|uniref:Uncharacterized protein n=1 Tax=Clostridium fallax TaxID=1533 RepID=A0A1M4TWS6_9CLOT|nr:hypothetical protein [Clostridium fallax]SHE48896.1 hypothetical protein SAMN05443638_103168 [Clostridium fallax]SQB22353.1 Uncharacterised protein [Clostridium fallax]
MRTKYNVFDFWERYISKNRTIRSRMFSKEKITKQTTYFHTVIFSKKYGIESMWGIAPNERMLLGYIQHSFLPEAFYKWIYSKNKKAGFVPIKTAKDIVKDAEKHKDVNKDDAKSMKEQITILNRLWDVPTDRLMLELKKFARVFNKKWFGSSSEFLYINVFKNSKELGEFVLKTNLLTDFEKNFEETIGCTEEQWLSLCDNVVNDDTAEEKFKEILEKHLNEVV